MLANIGSFADKPACGCWRRSRRQANCSAAWSLGFERWDVLDFSQQDLPVVGFRLTLAPMTPALDRVDHVHIYVADRAAAQRWYAEVLGLVPVPELASWAGGGPLTIGNASGSVHLALFERPLKECRSVVAFATGAGGFLAWRAHLAARLGKPVDAVDHQMAWSMYFSDPDGNPYEITSYDYDDVKSGLRP